MYIGSKNQRYEFKNYICIAKTLEAMEKKKLGLYDLMNCINLKLRLYTSS